jgi:hypothetical protein
MNIYHIELDPVVLEKIAVRCIVAIMAYKCGIVDFEGA